MEFGLLLLSIASIDVLFAETSIFSTAISIHDGKCVGPNDTMYDENESWDDLKACTRTTCVYENGKYFGKVEQGCKPNDDPYCWESRYRSRGPFPNCCLALICANNDS